MKTKKTIIADTIIEAVIEKSEAAVKARLALGAAGKSHPNEKIQAIFNEGNVFGCQTANVRRLVEAITGQKVQEPGVKSETKPFDLFLVSGITAIRGTVVIGVSAGSYWSPTSPEDTWTLGSNEVKPVDSARNKVFYNQVRKNASKFLAATKGKLPIQDLI